MDVLFEESHSEVAKDKVDNWRPFKLSSCKSCGKIPSVIRNLDIEGDGRYKISCCGVKILKTTETNTIYEWNLIQNPLPIE